MNSHTAAGRPMTNIRQMLRDAWAIIRPYWFSEDRWAGRGLLLAVIVLNLTLVAITVVLNKWYNVFYNALQDKNYDVFVRQLYWFALLAGSSVLVAVYELYLNQMLQMRWRRWLTNRYLTAWLTGGAYYRMQLTAGETDNPDQRIAEDVRLFIAGANGGTGALGLVIGGMRAVVTLVSFVVILWGLSGSFRLPWIGLTIPAYMVWAALLYALIGTWLTDRIGRPLVRLNFDQQRFEADFRFGLVRFRENTEGVALYRGEADELRGFRERFGAVVQNWWGIMRQRKRLTAFTAGYAQAAVIFPFIFAAPRFFRGEIQLGGLIQIAQAFGQVQDSLSYLVAQYAEIAEWRAVIERLAGFERTLDRVSAEAAVQGIHQTAGDDAAVRLDHVDLLLPGGRRLLEGIDLTFHRGDRALISGPTGAGKSTLFRAIAGIWPFGHGEIRMPAHGRVLFLPQKAYLPIGTLREVVSYPALPGIVSDAVLRETLEAVGLPELGGQLDESAHWALRLSPGEQQRIAFARALVQKPDWLFLDEATSAVDEAAEARLYQLIRERLPDTTLLSVGHRSTLRAFHDRQLIVKPNENAPASITEVALTS